MPAPIKTACADAKRLLHYVRSAAPVDAERKLAAALLVYWARSAKDRDELFGLEYRVSAALSAPSGVRFFVACCHFRVTACPRSGRTLQARRAIEGCSTSFGYAPCLPRSRPLSGPG